MSQVFVNKGLNAIVPIFLIPYYNKVFGVEQYGELVFVQSITILLMFISDYGFNITGTREASLYQHDSFNLGRTLSAIYAVKIGLTLICYLLLFLAGIIFSWKPSDYALYFVTFSAFAFQSLTPFWFFQGIGQNFLMTIANLASKVLLVILALVFVVQGSHIVTASLIEWISYVLAFGVSNLIIFFYLRLSLLRPSLQDIIRQVHAGKDIFLTTLLNWSITSGAIVVLKQFASEEELGYYGTFTRIIYYIFAVLQPVNQAFFPYISLFFSEHPQRARKWILRLAILYFGAVGLLFITGLWSSPKAFEFFFDRQFTAGLQPYFIIYIILFAWVCIVLVNNFIGIQCLMAAGKDALYRKFYSANAFTAMLGFGILIPIYKGLGAAISILSGEIVLLFLLLPSLIKTAKGVKETSPGSSPQS